MEKSKEYQLLEDAISYAKKQLKLTNLEGMIIDASDLIFEERVRMNCFYCGRYNTNWRCPPKIPDIDYKKMMGEFDCCAVVYIKLPFESNNYNDVRNESSVLLHKAILEMEKFLWNNNNSTCISFIGGGCKLCKNGCGKEKCNNPYMSRTPVEATGINLVKSLEKYGIHIVFPPRDYMYRFGLILF